MKKNIVLIIVLLASMLAAFGIARKLNDAPSLENQANKLLGEDGKTIGRMGMGYFNFEFAKTTAQREKGLSGRTSLVPTDALLFVFDTADKHCFWMKDMKFDIDILWFNADYKLVYQKLNVSRASYPEKFCPEVPAKYVAEVAAGVATKNQLHLGDKLDVKL